MMHSKNPVDVKICKRELPKLEKYNKSEGQKIGEYFEKYYQDNIQINVTPKEILEDMARKEAGESQKKDEL